MGLLLTMENEYTILVAFTVEGESRQQAHERLMERLPRDPLALYDPIIEWWVAEDERYDKSDNESAIFIPSAFSQDYAYAIICSALTGVDCT